MRLPFVPPETYLEKWHASLKRMLASGSKRIAPTHFGIFDNAEAHLTLAVHFLDEVEVWLNQNMSGIPDVETLGVRYADFLHAHGLTAGLDESTLKVYDGGNPINFAARGLFRYWQRVRN